MSETKFTKGPYALNDGEEIVAGQSILAMVYSSSNVMPHPQQLINGKRTTVVSPKEAKANMALFAAAPEMYAALEANRLWFEHNGFTMPPCYKMTIAALAKASGK